MIFQQVESPDDVAEVAFERIQHWLTAKSEPVFALPTGATPLPLYRRLIEATRDGRLPLARARFFALDEFWGNDLPESSTFRHFLVTRLLSPAGIPLDRLVALPTSGDPERVAATHESAIRAAGGLDLVLLGIGGNGHIAFNEPGTPHDSRTGLRVLTEKTRLANGYLFAGHHPIPTHGMTMGIGTIATAREVLLMASGSGKAGIIGRLQDGPVALELPASSLKSHGDARIVVDRAAGVALN